MKRITLVALIALLGGQTVWGQSIALGQEDPVEVASQLRQGTTYVQLRQLGELLGLEVEWKNGTVFLRDVVNELKITVENPKGSFNGITFEGTVAPIMVKDKVYLPLRSVAERFGYQVSTQSGKINCSRTYDDDVYQDLQISFQLLEKSMVQLTALKRNGWQMKEAEQNKDWSIDKAVLVNGLGSAAKDDSLYRQFDEIFGYIVTLYHVATIEQTIPEARQDQLKELEEKYAWCMVNAQKLMKQQESVITTPQTIKPMILDLPTDKAMRTQVITGSFYTPILDRYRMQEQFYLNGNQDDGEILGALTLTRSYRDYLLYIHEEAISQEEKEMVARYLNKIETILDVYRDWMLA